jgi:DNA repair exonuclease SbcCD nuclease subunit
MKKILYVGDPHVQVSNVKESENLFGFVKKIAEEQNVNFIFLLGDLFHTHAVKRVEVEDFWEKTLLDLAEQHKVIALVGNHDQVGSYEREQQQNSLNVFCNKHKNLQIVNKPDVIDGQILAMPHYSSHEEFLKKSKEFYDEGFTNLLVAHQTFTGAQYENGFFSEEGVDPALVAQNKIVSGHIHTRQEIGKCFYPGTAKWDTMADANQDKGLVVITYDDQYETELNRSFFSTKEVVSPILSFHIKEGEKTPELDKNARNYVVLEGKLAWIKKIKKEIASLAHIKVKPTDVLKKTTSHTTASWQDFFNHFSPIEGVDKKDIQKIIEETVCE